MRSSPETYATLLLNLTASTEHEEDLKERLDMFLRYLQARHDLHLLKKILRLFTEKFLKANGLQRFEVESTSMENEEPMKELERRFDPKTFVFTGRTNPKLISGVRMIHNDTRLIDSSFDGLVYQLLQSF